MARPATPRRPMARAWRRLILLAVGLPALAWGAASAALWVGQEHLLFKPVPLAAEAQLSPEPDVREHTVEVPGARLSVLTLQLPDPKGVVFFLHGNSANVREWFTDAAFYRRAGYDLVMMDYRGYGKSSGRIGSEAELHADVEAVWQSIAPRYAGRRVVVFGRSLGTGLAATWAARHQPDLTVLVSPYLSMVELARLHYPWVPGAILRYPLRSDLQLARIERPVLLIHGDRDGLIPSAHSLALATRNPRAEVMVVPGAGHADIHRFDSYQARLRRALADLADGRPGTRPGPAVALHPSRST